MRELYLVYLPEGGTTDLDLTGVSGEFAVSWFDPRRGGMLAEGAVDQLQGGGGLMPLVAPPREEAEDWLAVVKRR